MDEPTQDIPQRWANWWGWLLYLPFVHPRDLFDEYWKARPRRKPKAWPIPHRWPDGMCACPDCQKRAGVKHRCGGTEIRQTCDDCWPPPRSHRRRPRPRLWGMPMRTPHKCWKTYSPRAHRVGGTIMSGDQAQRDICGREREHEGPHRGMWHGLVWEDNPQGQTEGLISGGPRFANEALEPTAEGKAKRAPSPLPDPAGTRETGRTGGFEKLVIRKPAPDDSFAVGNQDAAKRGRGL